MDLCLLANITSAAALVSVCNIFLRRRRCWAKEKLAKKKIKCSQSSWKKKKKKSSTHFELICLRTHPPPTAPIHRRANPALYLVGSRTACSFTVEHNQHICKRKAGLWIKPFILSYRVVIHTQRLSKAYTLHSNPPCIRKPKLALPKKQKKNQRCLVALGSI